MAEPIARRLAAVLAAMPESDRFDHRIRAVRWRLDAGLAVLAAQLVEAADVAMQNEDIPSTIELARRAIDAGAQVRGGHLLGVALDEAGLADEAMEALERAWAADPDGARDAAFDDGYDERSAEEALVLLGLARFELQLLHVDDPAVASA